MLIDCIKTRDRLLNEVTEEVSKLKEKPCLEIFRVEGDEASFRYVKNKINLCKKAGITSIVETLDKNTPQDILIAKIKESNVNKSVHGILVQLPLPKHMNVHEVINSINPLKDVDCLTELNVGKLYCNNKYTTPCTPLGIIELLKDNFKTLEGLNVAIINRSMLVGKPLAELLQQENCTVTLCHSKTENLLEELRGKDIIITAVGKQNFIDFQYMFMLNFWNTVPEVFIVDVSINVNDEGKLCGDVDKKVYDMYFENVSTTPVPKGVGPLTVVSLLKNTLTCYKNLTNNID